VCPRRKREFTLIFFSARSVAADIKTGRAEAEAGARGTFAKQRQRDSTSVVFAIRAVLI
jgi:hypothetical protein